MPSRLLRVDLRMKPRALLYSILILSVLALTALGVFLGMASFDTSLKFQFEDFVSGGWVWGAMARLQERALIGFYQSDAGPVPYAFTHLKPGKSTLEITAQGYESVSVAVTLKRGANLLKEPIRMIGYEIPNLSRFAIFERLSGADVLCELRPIGTDDRAVVNHPCLNIWVGCRITIQLNNGISTQEPVEKGGTRGEELFAGKVTWEWDPLPQTVFRYTARIPGSMIAANTAPYRVFDYLVVVPDPRVISAEELESLMSKAPAVSDLAALKAYLDVEKARLRYFFDTSWNVKGKGQ